MSLQFLTAWVKIKMPGNQLQCKPSCILVLMSPCPCLWQFPCLDLTACCLQVDYSLELGPPIVTLQDARKQNSFHKLPALPGPNSNLPSGEKSALPHVQKCPMQIRGAKWHIPTQVQPAFLALQRLPQRLSAPMWLSLLMTKLSLHLIVHQACCHVLAQACMLLKMPKPSVGVQVHMYMEPQTAVAKWDEGGVIQVSCPEMYPTMR